MKVNHSFLFLPLLLSLTTALSAQENSKIPYEDIYLKDGSVYHGYIAEQTVATGQVVIEYIWAEYTFDGDKVLLSQFDDPVTSLIADGKAYSNIKVLETGDFVKFRVLNGGAFPTKSSEIVKTERPVYDGIYDLVTIRNTQQQHKGHIVETIPGKSIKLETDNGKVINILQKNIALQQRECKNKEKFNIVMQSPFSEEYVMTNGNVFKGVLVTQDNSSGLLTLSDNKGNPVAFLLKDIKIIRKTARPDFTVVSPKLGKNAVRVNGIEYTGIIGTPSQKDRGVLVDGDKHLPYALVEPGKLVVEVDNDEVKTDGNASPYSLFTFIPSRDDDGKYYRMEGIKSSKGSVTVTPDAHEKMADSTKYIYDNVARGLYCLLNMNTRNMLLIWVN
jgi:hypothetical protein